LNILFTIDGNYRSQAVTCIRSFARFETDGGYDVYIFHSGITGAQENETDGMLEKYGINNVRLHFIFVDPDRFKDYPITGNYPRMMYYRLFAAQYLPDDIERILYLDPDITVINPLETMYNMSFGERYFFACSHTMPLLNIANLMRLSIYNRYVPYINTGVILMNIKLLREQQDTSVIDRYVNEYGDSFTLPDQDVMTYLYGEKTGILSYAKYNLSDRMLGVYNLDVINRSHHIDIDWVRNNTVIIHYCGRNKPWKPGYVGLLGRFYDELVSSDT
jgi:lipopolysaccharide biosynthesis glycosyltransferase